MARHSAPSITTILTQTKPSVLEARRRQAREGFGRETPIPGAPEVDTTLESGSAPAEGGTASPWAVAPAGVAAVDAAALPSAAAPPVVVVAAPGKGAVGAGPEAARRRRRVQAAVGALLGLAVAGLAIALPLALGWRPADASRAVGSDAAAAPLPGSGAVAPSAPPGSAAAVGSAVPAARGSASAEVDAGAAPVTSGTPAPERPRPTGKRSQAGGEDPYGDAAGPAVRPAAPAVTAAPVVTAAPAVTAPASSGAPPTTTKDPVLAE